MKYHKCQAAGCTTKMSDGTPVLCPKHSQPIDTDFHEQVVGAFRDWAQQYLDGGRWAGYDYFTAIKTELLERDKEVKELKRRVSKYENEAQLFPIPRSVSGLSNEDKQGLVALLKGLSLQAEAISKEYGPRTLLRKSRREDAEWYMHLHINLKKLFNQP